MLVHLTSDCVFVLVHLSRDGLFLFHVTTGSVFLLFHLLRDGVFMLVHLTKGSVCVFHLTRGLCLYRSICQGVVHSTWGDVFVVFDKGRCVCVALDKG